MTRMTQTTTRSGSWYVTHRRWFGYGVAAIALAATILARYSLTTVTGSRSLPLLFIIPVALAAYAGGLGPTIAATLGGAIVEWMFFLPRDGSREVLGDEIAIALFVAAGVLLSITSEGLHRARGRAESVKRRLQEEADLRSRSELKIVELNDQLQRSLHEVSERERQMVFVMDSMPQKVFSATAEGVADYASTQWSEYTGLHPRQITAGAWVQAIHPDDRREGARRWSNAMRSGETFVYEHRIRRYDGEYRWHISRAVPQRDANGKIVLWVGSSTDVHELKMAQEALREADVLKDEFMATLAHELRNPLAPLVSSAEILAHSSDPAASEQARSTIRRQIGHMVRLVDDLLDVSRVTRNAIQIRKENTTLAAIIAAAVETVRDAAECSEQVITLTIPDEPIHLSADPVRLTQVFANLLNNACKYTPKGGSISVTARAVEGWVVVRVRDTGIGISRDKLSKIFGAFARVNRSVGDEQPHGLGIGLALARRVVDLHGGTVVAESEGEGRGSEFVVRLPVATRSSREIKKDRLHSESRPRPLKTPKRPQRVLVVDDNVDAAEALETLLSLGGIETRVAHDGMEALYAAAEFRPDAMIVDIGMPKLDGHGVAQRLRAAPWAAGMRLIALSGWAQEADRQKSRESGFDVHLAKPVTFTALMDALGDDGPQPTVRDGAKTDLPADRGGGAGEARSA